MKINWLALIVWIGIALWSVVFWVIATLMVVGD